MNEMFNEKAIFIGPYGENADEFMKLVATLMNDILQWRRNFDPRGKRLITSDDKEKADWKATSNDISRELDYLLGDLKQSIPLHSPRYIGHMISELAIPALLGYMAGQMYNQNNIVGEVSPVTTEKEMDFIRYLCDMVGYPPYEYPEQFTGTASNSKSTKQSSGRESNSEEKYPSSGHLTSGGSTANLEALWVARNVKYYPISLYLITKEIRVSDPSTNDFLTKIWDEFVGCLKSVTVNSKTIGEEKFGNLTARQLFNLPVSVVFDLREAISTAITDFLDSRAFGSKERQQYNTAIELLIKRNSVSALGVFGIHNELRKRTKGEEELELPILLVPQTKHYSWDKGMDIIGIGSDQIEMVKVDASFKIDCDDLRTKCKADRPILMVMAVVGSTEEGAIDPVAEILTVRKEIEQEGKSFFFHVDGAYGGYFAALVDRREKKVDKENVPFSIPLEKDEEDFKKFLGAILPDLKALSEVDSITIDPHKFGYVPYAVGAILYKDKRSKTFILKMAPYLAVSIDNSQDFDPAKQYLGGSSIEGSRSGAAALACYLTSKVISNDRNGYGRIAWQTWKNADSLINAFEVHNENPKIEEDRIIIKSLYTPQTNIVCYAINVPDYIKKPEHMKLLNERLYEEMSATKNRSIVDYEFFVTKTELPYDGDNIHHGNYQAIIDNFHESLEMVKPEPNKGYELIILRSVLMNPILDDEFRKSLFDKFVTHIKECVNKILPNVLLEILKESKEGNRFEILWVDNKKDLRTIKSIIEGGTDKTAIDFSRFLNIHFVNEWDEDLLRRGGRPGSDGNHEGYDLFVIDLNLSDSMHLEWISGIKAISDITKQSELSNAKKKPIMIYSQFFTLEGEDQIRHPNLPQILRNYFKFHANIDDSSIMGKTMSGGKEKLPEMYDIRKLILMIAKKALADENPF